MKRERESSKINVFKICVEIILTLVVAFSGYVSMSLDSRINKNEQNQKEHAAKSQEKFQNIHENYVSRDLHNSLRHK
jgi:hypothetical protein